MTDQRRQVRLSKFLALLLRHQPQRFGLDLDEQGWASLPHVLRLLHTTPHLRWADRSDVIAIAREGTGDGKKRFEIAGDRIRALYGHSFRQQIDYQPVEPPPHLYHGTSAEALPSIRHQGLRPMRRQYVHLSPDRQTAVQVGSRHAPRPIVITVRAAAAHAAGIEFYRPEETVYLVRCLPSRFLRFPEERRP